MGYAALGWDYVPMLPISLTYANIMCNKQYILLYHMYKLVFMSEKRY